MRKSTLKILCRIEPRWDVGIVVGRVEKMFRISAQIWTTSAPVWPEIWIKSSQKLSKSSHRRFYLKYGLFKVAQIVTKYLGYFCKKMLTPGTFKICPIWTHLSAPSSLSLFVVTILHSVKAKKFGKLQRCKASDRKQINRTILWL